VYDAMRIRCIDRELTIMDNLSIDIFIIFILLLGKNLVMGGFI
jgi:hypothetical protein